MIIDTEGIPRRLTSGGLPIGAISGDHWVAHDFVLEHGDVLVVVSDGILDFFDDPADGLAALSAARRPRAECPADGRRRSPRSPSRSGPTDDVTVVVVKRSGA